jgi:hypothetical protein
VRPVGSKAFIDPFQSARLRSSLRADVTSQIKRADHLLLIALDELAYVTSAARAVKRGIPANWAAAAINLRRPRPTSSREQERLRIFP